MKRLLWSVVSGLWLVACAAPVRPIGRVRPVGRVRLVGHPNSLVPFSLQPSAFILTLTAIPSALRAQAERFPPPEFTVAYQAPKTALPASPMEWLAWLDVGVLLVALILASVLALRKRSRLGVVAVLALSLAYFGFYRHGCVCSVGAVQNVALSVGSPAYGLSLPIALVFLLPLAFALFTGRTFCSSVCPLGAVQDLVLFRPLRVPSWLEHALGLLPVLYVGAAVLFSCTGSAFLICEYDPFVSFFRLSGGPGILVFGVLLLAIGAVVGRPYCRFLCPYGLLLRWLSPLARWRVSISPTECISCRLCEDSCPFGAIEAPTPDRQSSRPGRKGLLAVIALLPVLIGIGGWRGYRDGAVLARTDPEVRLADRVWLEDQGIVHGTTPQSDAFRLLAQPSGELYWEATRVRRRIVDGSAWLGAWIGLVIGLKLIGLCIPKRRSQEFKPSSSNCLACGRCYLSCPVERTRLDEQSPWSPPVPSRARMPSRMEWRTAMSRTAMVAGVQPGPDARPQPAR